MKNTLTTILVGFALFIIPKTSFSQTTNLISFNIRYDNTSDTINNWNKRKASLASLIQHYDADIVGIQEGLHHQVDYLNNTLNGFSYVGVGRDDGQQKGEYSAIFYNSDKFKVLKTNTFWLSETPEKVSVGWDASMERICTYALFENVTSKKQFYVFNTHFDHRGMQARVNSAELIYKKIKEINTSDLPVILMGDLNLTPDTEPIQFLKKHLTDAMGISKKPFYGPIGTFNGFDQDRIMENRIDYIFVNNIEVLSYTHIDDRMANNMHISDHLPVLITLKN
ncbi:endonuclease/exonuclease/phosphatase family protein [Arenibacter algicola]|uniref:Endonuclease/exonuclease/phosphatase family protein n=1 Tax=Arenibacter algicola TaxID=616991 RepID=A0A221V446_9FLAO|nr:endonuclease/exonuclease/phosphatase family protein [Arenibacter algicola]ASO08158.1 endonuclease/exonuclease/phosphatase family protein [Arenibacter algicola]|tara:strand:- start:42 stop:884 length:843 start_codon:yes stop_codon:yes gene_type:complete